LVATPLLQPSQPSQLVNYSSAESSIIFWKEEGDEDLFILRASFFHFDELATSEFWFNLHHSRRPKQTFAKWACLIYEHGAMKLLFFLQQWPQKGAVSVTGCKMWSANP
jgi:hypothetical protein